LFKEKKGISKKKGGEEQRVGERRGGGLNKEVKC